MAEKERPERRPAAEHSISVAGMLTIQDAAEKTGEYEVYIR
jgi:hypothetical protein